MLRIRWRILARNGLLIVLALCAVSASAEYALERRDAARLTANDSFYAIGGRHIRYHLTGQGAQGPTVVLVNGLTASLEQWNSVQTALGATAPVLSYDRGGSGFSDPADAHDAVANADELNQILHSPEIVRPVVLVSYSSSAMMAIVFAARYPEAVKGMVFVDPTMRPRMPGTKTYKRIYLRPSLFSPLEAFFGFTRLKFAIAGRDAPSRSPVAERTNAILVSTHHWLASAHEAMNLDKSADEADAAQAARSFAGLPVGVVTTIDPAGSEGAREFYDRQTALAARSKRGIVRTVHTDHSVLLNDPVAVGSIVDLIRLISNEERASSVADLY
jgi:pimeloyl-ACP methyl ester carboxylesterase